MNTYSIGIVLTFCVMLSGTTFIDPFLVLPAVSFRGCDIVLRGDCGRSTDAFCWTDMTVASRPSSAVISRLSIVDPSMLWSAPSILNYGVLMWIANDVDCCDVENCSSHLIHLAFALSELKWWDAVCAQCKTTKPNREGMRDSQPISRINVFGSNLLGWTQDGRKRKEIKWRNVW